MTQNRFCKEGTCIRGCGIFWTVTDLFYVLVDQIRILDMILEVRSFSFPTPKMPLTGTQTYHWTEVYRQMSDVCKVNK